MFFIICYKIQFVFFLIQDKFNLIVHLIKKYIHKHTNDVKINILLNLVIYKFLKYITIKDSQINTVLN